MFDLVVVMPAAAMPGGGVSTTPIVASCAGASSILSGFSPMGHIVFPRPVFDQG